MSTKELQKEIAGIMKDWQEVEDTSVESTGNIISKTDNPLIKLVMEIIQQDSQMHYRVQELIKDSLEGTAYAFTPDDIGIVNLQTRVAAGVIVKSCVWKN